MPARNRVPQWATLVKGRFKAGSALSSHSRKLTRKEARVRCFDRDTAPRGRTGDIPLRVRSSGGRFDSRPKRLRPNSGPGGS